MLGVSPSMWAWIGALAPGLWFIRTVIGALLVERITRTVVEKADAKDLPEVLTGLGALAGALSAPGRHDPQTAGRAVAVPDGAGVQEGRPAR
jgi:hypothetical protein